MYEETNKIILTNGLILADPDSAEVLRHGMTVVEGDRLSDVNIPLSCTSEDDFVIDCSGCLIMPGLVNTHCHAAMSLLRGLADDKNLSVWLNDYIFAAEAAFVSPEFVRVGSILSFCESVLAGTTTIADAYFFMESSAEAAISVGIRSVCAQGILAAPTPDCSESGNWPERLATFLEDCPKNPLITPAVFCHSPYLCSPDTYRRSKKICDEKGMLLFSHVSETEWEKNEILNRYGNTPALHLAQLGVLDRNFIAVHCVAVTDEEAGILAESQCGIVHCPKANMKLASGAAPISQLLELNARLSLGTDGPASNNNLDLFDEMRTAALLSKVMTGNSESFSARQALRAATMGGAEVLGLSDKIGVLEAGKLADLIVMDMSRPHLNPAYDVLSNLVYAAKGSDVRDVIINGRVVVLNSVLQTVSSKEAISEAQTTAAEIARHLGVNHFRDF